MNENSVVWGLLGIIVGCLIVGFFSFLFQKSHHKGMTMLRRFEEIKENSRRLK
jgi:hypothetical protein